MFKKFFCVLVLFALVGCASISIPKYIKNDNPYKKTLYASFEKVLPAAIRTLEAEGWKIEERADPGVYEMRTGEKIHQGKQVLLITGVRKLPVFVASSYARLNVYVTSGVEESTEVEVRYLTVNSVTFKSFYNYAHDRSVKKLLEKIEENVTK